MIFMRLVPRYILSNLFLFYCFISAIETENSLIKNYPIDISVYNGEGTLLISWSAPDSIRIEKTKLYYKKFGDEDYSLLTELSPDIFNYLHIDCIPDARYFYKIEIEDIFNSKYYSDLDQPSFGTCLMINDSNRIDKNIENMFDLIFAYIDRELANYSAFNHFQVLSDLLKSNLRNQYNWIENFPLDIIKSVHENNEFINNIILDDDLYNHMMDYENLYRNHFLLSPEKWSLQLNEAISKIRNNWIILYNEYPHAIDFYDSIDPVRILGYNEGKELQNPILQLHVFHPDKMNASEWYLLSNDEYINLENHDITNEYLISFEIPETWDHVNLMMDDEIIQSCPIIHNQSVTYTLTGEIIPLARGSDDYIKVTREASSIWFNEISWNPIRRIVSIELAGRKELYEEYIVKYDEKTIWNVVQNQFGFEMQFIDSTFVLDDSLKLPRFISLQKKTVEDSIFVEYILLDTSSFTISRVNDNGNWIHSSLTTLGSTNEIVKDEYNSSLIPDFFVLYQNYPNPFNGQTRITFDLLEDAVVTLYVSDATGRIHDRIIETEYITSGNYNFLWNGDGRSSGIYFITIQAELEDALPAVYSRKMIYLK